MDPSPPLPDRAPPEFATPDQALPAQDLRAAIEIVLARDAHLFTAGELGRLDALVAGPPAALALAARLFSRQPRVFLLDELRYAELPDLPAAAALLEELGFALRPERFFPARLLQDAHTAEGLKQACRALGRPIGGRRDDLAARLLDEAAAKALAAPMIWLCHRGLLRRVCRLYLHDHEGDLSRLVVARLEHVRFPVYTPTGGGGLFPTRGELLAYEAGRKRLYTVDGAALLGEVPALLARLQAPPPAPWRYRFSGWRCDEALALPAAQLLERQGDLVGAEALLRVVADQGQRQAGEAAWRLALLLGKAGRPAEGAALCAQRWPRHPPQRAAFARTGKRLARAARIPWVEPPPLQDAPQRAFLLEPGPVLRARPRWRVASGLYAVEGALVALLAGLGRQAIHVENEVWTTIFALLFRDVIFAPIPGMLPTPLLLGPLDLGTPAFFPARRGLIEARLAAIAAGEAQARIAAVIADHAGEAIIGLRWDLFGEDPAASLIPLVEALGGPRLAALLRPLAEDYATLRRGMPDLVVLPGPAVDLAAAGAGVLGPGLLFAEVKGPGDQLRDEQRHAHHRLLGDGVAVELWTVAPTGAAPGLASGPIPSEQP